MSGGCWNAPIVRLAWACIPFENLKTFKMPTFRLMKHMGTHSEPKFECEICKMKFTQHVNMTKHLLTHNGPKNFACTICGRKFLRKSYLTTHMVSRLDALLLIMMVITFLFLRVCFLVSFFHVLFSFSFFLDIA